MTNIDGLDLISPQAYGERGLPHDQWRELRALERLQRFCPEGFDPFYAVVRHDQNGSETLIFGIYALDATVTEGRLNRILRGIVLPAGTPSRAR